MCSVHIDNVTHFHDPITEESLGDWVMPLGKYKGTALKNIPVNSLKWYAENLCNDSRPGSREVAQKISAYLESICVPEVEPERKGLVQLTLTKAEFEVFKQIIKNEIDAEIHRYEMDTEDIREERKQPLLDLMMYERKILDKADEF